MSGLNSEDRIAKEATDFYHEVVLRPQLAAMIDVIDNGIGRPLRTNENRFDEHHTGQVAVNGLRLYTMRLWRPMHNHVHETIGVFPRIPEDYAKALGRLATERGD